MSNHVLDNKCKVCKTAKSRDSRDRTIKITLFLDFNYFTVRV